MSGGGARGIHVRAGGLQVQLHSRRRPTILVSGGMTYFVPGSQGGVANFGSGDYHFFLTAGKEIFGSGHWLSATGFRIPADPSFGTQLWYWSNQWDYRVSGNWYALTGINWYHFMTDSKLNFPAPVTGLDLLNLPVTGVAGTNVTTCVVGTKWKPKRAPRAWRRFRVSALESHRYSSQSPLCGRDLPLLGPLGLGNYRQKCPNGAERRNRFMHACEGVDSDRWSRDSESPAKRDARFGNGEDR